LNEVNAPDVELLDVVSTTFRRNNLSDLQFVVSDDTLEHCDAK
jgi:hypothetical protein